jgi:hypothetical protein
MSEPVAELAVPLRAWLEDRDATALDRACIWAKAHPFDVGALLQWVSDYGADEETTSLALRRLRFAIGLPVIAGPVCRR